MHSSNDISHSSKSTCTNTSVSSLSSQCSTSSTFFNLSAYAQNNIGFDITVLGSSGGPIDGRTCSYLIKTSDISFKEIVTDNLNERTIAVDAGCGLTGINDIILEENKHLYSDNSYFFNQVTNNSFMECFLLDKSSQRADLNDPVNRDAQISVGDDQQNDKPTMPAIKNLWNSNLRNIFNKSKDISSRLTQQQVLSQSSKSNAQLRTMIENSYNQNPLLRSYSDSLHFMKYTNCHIKLLNLNCKELGQSSYQVSMKLQNNINDYLITHPHLDHISGLVINSAGFDNKHMPTKKIYGSQFTIEALKKHVFNGIIWPNLQCDANGRFLKLVSFDNATKEHDDQIIPLSNYFQVKAFEVNHGVISDGSSLQRNDCAYKSSTFLIKSLTNNKFILIFGDLETSNKNLHIWDSAALLILHSKLSGMIIECSTCNVPVNTPLFGHLTPTHLFNELIYLANKIRKLHDLSDSRQKQYFSDLGFDINSPLLHLKIIISHVKETTVLGKDPRKIILSQLNELNDKYNLGCSFTIAFSGLTYSI